MFSVIQDVIGRVTSGVWTLFYTTLILSVISVVGVLVLIACWALIPFYALKMMMK